MKTKWLAILFSLMLVFGLATGCSDIEGGPFDDETELDTPASGDLPSMDDPAEDTLDEIEDSTTEDEETEDSTVEGDETNSDTDSN